jgi:hypothetical protein
MINFPRQTKVLKYLIVEKLTKLIFGKNFKINIPTKKK